MLYHAMLVAALLAPCTQEEAEGILAPARIVPTAAIVPLRPAVVDLDADGDLDLAIANGFLQLQPPLVELQFQDGDGHLLRSVNLTSPTSNPFAMPRYCVAHDFDGDALPEITVVYSDGHIEIFPNAGNGVFAAPHRLAPGFLGSGAAAVSYSVLCHAVTDLDLDGRKELVLPFLEFQLFYPRRSMGLVILEYDGGSAILLNSSGALGTCQAALVAADVDGDHRVDLAGVDGSQDLTYVRGDGRGGFSTVHQVPLDTRGLRADELATADLDGDGDADLVVGYGASAAFEILWNQGGGVFGSNFHATSNDPHVGIRGTLLCDLDGDRRLELVLLEAGHPGDRGRVAVWRDLATVPITGTPVDAGVQSVGTDIGPEVLALGDLDGNATPDLVVAGYRDTASGTPQIGVFSNRSAAPFRMVWSGTGAVGSNGSVPEIRCGGGPAVLSNSGFWIEVRGGLPLARTTLFLGAETNVSYAAGGIELLLVPLHISIVFLDHAGAYRWNVPISGDPTLVGEWGFAQAWLTDPWAPTFAGLSATRRLGVLVGERW